MARTSLEKTRTYVTATRAGKRRPARCMTVYGLGPREVIRLIRDAIRTQQQKAG